MTSFKCHVLDGEYCQCNNRTADLHPSAIIDYSYHSDLKTFSVLDHFLFSETMFNNASISSVYAMHDVDNTSGHEFILLQLCLQIRWFRLFSILNLI